MARHAVRTALRRCGCAALLPALLLCALFLSAPAHAADTTYLFETTTGTATGDEKKIEFFIITYRDTANEEHAQLLYPFEDSLTESYESAGAVSTEQWERDAYIRSTYGYDVTELTYHVPFQ